MSQRATTYTSRPGVASPWNQATRITTAVRIARRFRDRVPSRDQLMTEFGMSKATACRWRAALLDAQEEACGS